MKLKMVRMTLLIVHQTIFQKNMKRSKSMYFLHELSVFVKIKG